MDSEKKIIGRCPFCGGNVVKTCKGYRCENNTGEHPSCVLNINAIIGNRKMNDGEIAEFLEKRHILLDGFATKEGKTFPTVLELADDGAVNMQSVIGRCPHCGGEAFPWVRGYGNFLQGKKYEEEYEKISKYIQKNKDRKILLIELGVGRMTPMFIQEPFWELTNSLKDAYYISVNSEYQFLPEFIEDKGIAILGDIGTVLKDLRKAKEESAFVC